MAAAPTEPAATAYRDQLLEALKGLLALLGRPVGDDLSWLSRERAGAPMGLDGLQEAAERRGFQARRLPLRRGAIARLPVPCLLIGREPGRAWIVRERTASQLVLIEPEDGTTAVVSHERALAIARQAIVLSAMAGTAAPVGQSWRRQVLRRAAPNLTLIGTASVVINLLGLATPLFMMAIYNKVISHAALRTLDVLLIGMVSVAAFELVLRGLRGYIAAHSGARLEAALGREVIRHLLALPLATVERAGTPQLVEHVRQLDQVRGFISGHLPLLLVDLAFVGLFLAALAAVAPTLALLTALALPAFLVLPLVTFKAQRNALEAGARAAAAKNAALAEATGQAATVKFLALEPDVERRIEQPLLAGAAAGFLTGRRGQLLGAVSQAAQQLVAVALVYVGARLVVAGEMSVGALVAGSILSARAVAPVRQAAAWGQMQQVRESMRRLEGLMAQPAEPQRRDLELAQPLRGHVRIEALGFAYPGAGRAALEEVTLDITPGTMLGIAGPPGSGKSTLLKLLLGLETPLRGRVLFDDLDLVHLPLDAVRRQVGVVPQDIQLFAGTIAENIAMGAADRSLARLIAAARFTGAHEFIRLLPHGYDTRLGERGAGLSMGQRQLVALARAVVRNPRLLILDEATSALDPAAETALIGNLKRAGKGRTILLVTHRPSVLAACDRAALLEGGRITRLASRPEIAAQIRATVAADDARMATG